MTAATGFMFLILIPKDRQVILIFHKRDGQVYSLVNGVVLSMPEYRERKYRKSIKAGGLVSFNAAAKETDLWISADSDLTGEAVDLILQCRHQIETYIRFHPDFLTALTPYPEDHFTPPVIKEMIQASRVAGVGPMASVAGAVAGYVGRGLLSGYTEQVIVENGGDIYLKADRAVTVSLFAGKSVLSGKLGIKVPVEKMPLGICSSSGTVGHSLSMGRADMVCLVSCSALIADAAATAVCNRIFTGDDLERAAVWAGDIEGISGGVVILDDQMAAWGDIELVSLNDKK